MTSEVGNLLGKPKESKVYEGDSRWVLPKALIGMEFEYEGVPDPETFMANNSQLLQYWDEHRDDSLKDHGCEFVYRVPLFGTDSYKAIDWLVQAAIANKFKCSLRAGIHVHLDARDMESSQLVGLIILYLILEPVIFNWIGDGREHSIYCVPLFKADESLLEAVKIVKSVYFDEIHETTTTLTNAKNFARYAAFNLNALAKFGSVEFRHMKTCHDFQRIIDWVNIIQSLKAATNKLPTSDGAIIRLAQSQPATTFLTYIFGPELAKKLWTPASDAQIRRIGIPTARDLVLHGLSMSQWNAPVDDVPSPKGVHLGFKHFLEGLEDQSEYLQVKKPSKKNAVYQSFQIPQTAPPNFLHVEPQQSMDQAIQQAQQALAQGVFNSLPSDGPQPFISMDDEVELDEDDIVEVSLGEFSSGQQDFT